jgi:hypothetical protein
MFLRRRRRRRRRRPLRLSRCSYVVVPRPSQPAVGEVPTGAGSLVYNDNVAYVIGEMKGKIGAAHSGPSGYASV